MKNIIAVILALFVFGCSGDENSYEYPITGTGGSGTGGEVSVDPIDPVEPVDPVNPVVSTDADFVSGGLGTDGTWNGYLFTASDSLGSTISPSEFTGSNLCVTGELAADESWGTWALVGWNIAQDVDPDTFVGGTVNAISPGGLGVDVKVVNNEGTPLRVQIQSDDKGTESWCTDLPSSGEGQIPWSSFKKQCWKDGGETYDGSTPIAQVAVQVPAASNTSSTPFDYCVTHLGSY